MATTHKNRVQMTVTSVASSGLGTITLNAAASGYQSLASAYGADAVGDFLFVEGTAWEVARDCAYTHSGTTLSRGTLEASSTGSAISLTSAAVVSQIATAEVGNRLERAMQAVTPGGRLTLESGEPVSTADQTAKTTIYYTPYVHDTIPLWDGSRWAPTTFSQYTLALGTLTSGKPYDVFAYLSSGALACEMLVWTNDTTRATAVTLQDGRYCKSGDKTRLYLGTFYTTATTTTEDSKANRYVWNAYNRVARNSQSPVGASHTYNTSTLREWNNGSGTLPRCQVLAGLSAHASFVAQAFVSASAAIQNSTIRIYLDGSTDISGTDIQFYNSSSWTGGSQIVGVASAYLSAGKHYATIFEAEYGGTITYDKGAINSTGWLA